MLVEHSTLSLAVTSSARESICTCVHSCPHPSTAAVLTFKRCFIAYSHPMIIDSKSMESVEEEALLGEESEEENSDLSNDEVSEMLSC